MTELKNKFKIGDKVICYNRTGIIVNLFEGTQIENIFVKILYDQKHDDPEAWLTTEKINNIELIIEHKIITIII
jgi:hypothetical protein